MPGTVTGDELAALVERISGAAQALISGDIEGYTARITHAHDYTLMSPYGGDTVRGFYNSDRLWTRWLGSFGAARRLSKSWRPTPQATWPCSPLSNDSTARSVTSPSRTGRCA